MLSAADADLAQRDQAIAGLAMVMDPDALVAALRTVRPELNVSSAQLTYLRYRPTRSCLGAYRVVIQDVAKPMLTHVTAYSMKAWAKLPTSIDNHHIALQDQVLVSFFPGDTKLTSLTQFMNSDNRQDILKTLMPANVETWTADIETLAYKPERRYVGRINCEYGAGALLKHYRKTEYRKSASVTIMDCPSTARLRIPRTLGRSEHHQSLVFEWLPGRLLDTEISTAPVARSLYAAGAVLAEFHALATDGLEHRTRNIQADKLTAIAATIAQLHPPLTSLAQDIATRVGEKLLQEPRVAQRIHGDFYAKQVVLMEAGQVAIIDHDENVCGDPMEDLGLFIAHLLRDKYNGRIAHSQTEILIEAFINGYLEAFIGGGQFAAQQQMNLSLRYYIAAGLFSLTHSPFRAHTPNWPEDTQIMLQHIKDILHSPCASTWLS